MDFFGLLSFFQNRDYFIQDNSPITTYGSRDLFATKKT